jgi:hypothetical protein
MAKDIAVIRERQKFLKKHKLTPRMFAESTNNDIGTAQVWFRTGRTPRRKYLEDILALFPDFPIIKRP